MNSVISTVLLGVLTGTAFANPYFVDNPYSTFPPSCINEAHTPPLAKAVSEFNTHARVIWEGTVSLHRAESPHVFWDLPFAGTQTASLRMIRVGCAEPNRSMLVASFRIPQDVPESTRYLLPTIFRDYNGFGGPFFNALKEPGEWSWNSSQAEEGHFAFGDYRFGWSYDGMGWFDWTFILDQYAPGWEAGPEPETAESYNARFTAGLASPVNNPYIGVPATRDVLERNPRLPLNGRLSGTWVLEGASDQGLVLNFSNRVPYPADNPEATPLFLFLAWYTFDSDGRMLWLTGQAEFAQGATRVEVPILATAAGAFLGGKHAQRTEVGRVILTAINCNNLKFDYELPGLGLGAGTSRLQRLYALEIAGYNCRDYEARQQSLTTHP